MSVRYKDHVIMWVKEYSRTIDYLETRKDMQADKVAYLGISWGGYMGGIIPAIEKRIKVVVLNVGGMVMDKSLPEVDQINYLPRVRQPVLMLNGTYDMYFPVETSQKPMFRFLGTADNQKTVSYTHLLGAGVAGRSDGGERGRPLVVTDCCRPY